MLEFHSRLWNSSSRMALVSNWVNWGPEKWDMRNEIRPWRSSSYLVAKPWPGTGSLNIPQSFPWVLWWHWDFYKHGGTVSTSRLGGTRPPLRGTKLPSSGLRSQLLSSRLENQRQSEKNHGASHSVGARTRPDASRQTPAHSPCPDLSLFHPPAHPGLAPRLMNNLAKWMGRDCISLFQRFFFFFP